MRWLTFLFSAQSHHSHVLCHVLCFLVGGSANGKREEGEEGGRGGRERREGEEGGRGGRERREGEERRRRKERKVRRKGDSD